MASRSPCDWKLGKVKLGAPWIITKLAYVPVEPMARPSKIRAKVIRPE